jgi:hypothetical protein
MSAKMTKEEFIEKARQKHGDKYDYSKVNYKNSTTEVIITCPIHGDFPQTPRGHLHIGGCRFCGIELRGIKRRNGKDKFIEKCNKIHNNKFSYEKVEYVNNKTPVIITCPIHGDFTQRPDQHILYGCSKCA